MKCYWYILDPEIGEGRVPVPCDDQTDWGKWFSAAAGDGSRFVGKTQVGMLLVSTVFLGMDHGSPWNDSPPVLFETMVFDENMDAVGRWFCRGSTWESAHWDHKETVMEVEEETGCSAVPTLSE